MEPLPPPSSPWPSYFLRVLLLRPLLYQESGFLELRKPGGMSHCREECETIAKVRGGILAVLRTQKQTKKTCTREFRGNQFSIVSRLVVISSSSTSMYRGKLNPFFLHKLPKTKIFRATAAGPSKFGPKNIGALTREDVKLSRLGQI